MATTMTDCKKLAKELKLTIKTQKPPLKKYRVYDNNDRSQFSSANLDELSETLHLKKAVRERFGNIR